MFLALPQATAPVMGFRAMVGGRGGFPA